MALAMANSFACVRASAPAYGTSSSSCSFRTALRADAGLAASFKPRAAAAQRLGAVQVSAEAGPTFDAIIEVGGTQQIVTAGRYYSCNSLRLEAGTKLNFERVLAAKVGGEVEFGMPYVKNAKVQATVLEAYRGKKQIVYKMKPKKHYRKKTGHRQELTKFLVTGVTTE